jgi:putative sporulation protein YtxC
LVEIIFQNKEDVKKLYSRLKKSILFCDDILLFEERHTIKINVRLLDEQIQSQITNVFYEFIIQTKRDEWLRRIIMEQFFYTDFDEQQQILEIIYSIMDGENEELLDLIEDPIEVSTIREAILDLLQDTNIAFSFDAFVKFRLKGFREQLLKYVEISIDEYKMEQEYQMFIHMLREFLYGQKEKIHQLYLVYKDEPVFYNEEFQEIKKSEIAKMIDRKLLFNHPVYVDSVTIAPLLSIAPKKVNLFVKNPDEPLIRTIKNIFEERIVIYPIELFEELRLLHYPIPSEKIN